MNDILGEIIGLLTGGITEYASAIGNGLKTMVQGIFLETTGTGADATTSLSTFGAIIVIFAGLSLAIGLSRWVVNFVTSLGKSN